MCTHVRGVFLLRSLKEKTRLYMGDHDVIGPAPISEAEDNRGKVFSPTAGCPLECLFWREEHGGGVGESRGPATVPVGRSNSRDVA